MTSNNCGIYKITNTVTRKFYIGSAVNIKKRWACHRYRLSANTHHSRHLQNSWNKHGEDSFTFEVLEYCEKERLIEREQFYIDNEKPAYNISPTAGNSLGVKHTDDTKRKMSETRKGRKGKNHTDETKRKMSEAMKGEKNPFYGKNRTDENKRNISEAMKGEKNPFYGKNHTDETKRKISEASKGKPMSEEARRKLSEASKGNTRCVGYKHTDETKRKKSEAMKRFWAERKANV